MSRRLLFMSSLIFGFLIWFFAVNEAMATKKYYIKWGSTSMRSGLYAVTAAMAKIVNKAYPGEIEVTVVESLGFFENLSRLQRKSIHLGPADASAGYAIYKGILDYQGKANPNLRTLWGGYITPIHLVVDVRTGIKDIRELTGVPFALNPGTTSGRLVEMFFKSLNIKPDYKK